MSERVHRALVDDNENSIVIDKPGGHDTITIRGLHNDVITFKDAESLREFAAFLISTADRIQGSDSD
ncbi:MAG: hypothetical protein ACOC0P_00680 [Planctomycetota bacterium]